MQARIQRGYGWGAGDALPSPGSEEVLIPRAEDAERQLQSPCAFGAEVKPSQKPGKGVPAPPPLDPHLVSAAAPPVLNGAHFRD